MSKPLAYCDVTMVTFGRTARILLIIVSNALKFMLYFIWMTNCIDIANVQNNEHYYHKARMGLQRYWVAYITRGDKITHTPQNEFPQQISPKLYLQGRHNSSAWKLIILQGNIT